MALSSILLLVLGLSKAISARALDEKCIKWSSCDELNKNVTEFVSPQQIDHFECGHLTVPLDYTDPASEPLQLNLFRIKAKKEPVLGTIIFNSGGPGGNGAVDFPVVGSDLRANVGDQYHLLSWDPRGTGFTIPFICNATATTTSGSDAPQKRDLGNLTSTNLTKILLNGGWESAGAVITACQTKAEEVSPYIGTSFVARDLLEMVDALAEDGLLRYYGWSYGTALGSYFAAMFPDRVERMVLDGNVDPEDYRAGHYGDNIRDADATFAGFLKACYKNKAECPLVDFFNATSAEDILESLNAILQPLAAELSQNLTSEASAAYSAIKQTILMHQGLYFPALYPSMAENLVMLLNATEPDSADESAGASPKWTYGESAALNQAGIAIRGADATWHIENASDYVPQAEYQSTVSSFSDLWYYSTWTAAQWKVPAKERFYGGFNTTTKHPILYVNGKYDPVTPLKHAERASKRFKGSVVLEHGGYGHGVFADPSTCVQKHVQAYFDRGVLPEEGSSCEPDLGIWELAKARKGLFAGALPPPE